MKHRIQFLRRRREFISLVCGAAAWPLAVRAQQPDRMRRIGVLMPFAESDPEYQGWMASFRDALVKLGWVEGRNLRIDYRWAGGDVGKLSGYAAELVALKPDAIFVMNSVAVAALQRATRSVPIVFADLADPIAAGFVSSVARPGGNITGLATPVTGAKRLELLKQLAPSVTRVLFIYDPSSPIWSVFFAETEAAASSLGVKASAAPVHNVAEIEAAIDAFAREPNGGLITLANPPVIAHRDKIFTLAARHRLPAVYPQRFFVAEGGLASYGVDRVEQCRRAASYVDRILKGAEPGDLPVQFADKFELVINLKTAKALGLDPPISLLARTDEVIE
jgi:putative tryptophan/tyrosine transport system substrate-binding protein